MNGFPPIRVLAALLLEAQLYDTKKEKDSIWISGTIDGVAFTCQLNIDGAWQLYDKQFAALYPELG